jgi:GxxExxY protein
VLAYDLKARGLRVERRVPIPIALRGIRFDEGFRADLVVEDTVLVELKSVERVTKAHQKQVLTYLRLTGLTLGYLLNFGEALMKNGIHRIINGSVELLPVFSVTLCEKKRPTRRHGGHGEVSDGIHVFPLCMYCLWLSF